MGTTYSITNDTSPNTQNECSTFSDKNSFINDIQGIDITKLNNCSSTNGSISDYCLAPKQSMTGGGPSDWCEWNNTYCGLKSNGLRCGCVDGRSYTLHTTGSNEVYESAVCLPKNKSGNIQQDNIYYGDILESSESPEVAGLIKGTYEISEGVSEVFF